MQNRNRLTDIANKLWLPKGRWKGRGTNQGYEISKLIYTKQISNKDIMYSKGNYSDLSYNNLYEYNLQKY